MHFLTTRFRFIWNIDLSLPSRSGMFHSYIHVIGIFDFKKKIIQSIQYYIWCSSLHLTCSKICRTSVISLRSTTSVTSVCEHLSSVKKPTLCWSAIFGLQGEKKSQILTDDMLVYLTLEVVQIATSQAITSELGKIPSRPWIDVHFL